MNLSDQLSSITMVVEEAGKIILKPKLHYPESLDEFFADYDGNELRNNDRFEWDKPVGRELNI